MEKTSSNNDELEDVPSITFKQPILIGKVGHLPRKSIVSSKICNETVDKIVNKSNDKIIINKEKNEKLNSDNEDASFSEEQNHKEPTVSLSYVEPKWSGLPKSDVDYCFEVLKSGVIIEKINLMKKSYWVFGRLPSCDIYMAHPTISRYHAILQYKVEDNFDRPTGFYLYDLGSTHGTFLNKNRLKPKMYVRIQVGHMLKLGCSTRSYLLVGPEKDSEGESELTLTELKEKRALELREKKEAELREAHEREELKRKEDERGIDWGMGEDADEETDLTENPYAETNNEQLYLEDPKRTLRGFMEREGHELHYEVTERGMGQFLCSVVLPVDDDRGCSIVAEALVKGKKKEAVVQCALEACRILDRHGLLRQATHESKKRKAKNWEENDFYDSDEDPFLDRTGTIERKRELRMKSKQLQQPETYQSLVTKEENISRRIQDIEKHLSEIACAGSRKNNLDDDIDSLDYFMNELNSNKPDKFTIGKLRNELTKLRKEHSDVIKLVNIARPAHLPPLVVQSSSGIQEPSTSGMKANKTNLPIFGKRLKVKVVKPIRPELKETFTNVTTIEEEQIENIVNENQMEMEQTDEEPIQENSEAEISTRKGIIKQLGIKMSLCDEKALTSLDNKVKLKISKTVTKLRKIAEEEERIIVDEKRLAVQKKKIFEQISSTNANDIEKHMKLTNVLNKMTGEFCTIGDRKIKIVDKINKLADDINNIAIEIRTASQVQHVKAIERMKEFVEITHKQQTEIFNELEILETSVSNPEVVEKLKELYEWLSTQKIRMLENLEKLKNVKLTENTQLFEDIIEFELKSDRFITTLLDELRKMRSENDKQDKNEFTGKKIKLNDDNCSVYSSDENETESLKDVERRKKKNLRRISQRQEKAEAEKRKQYEEDAQREDYNMWVPPEGQTGDGRTILNDKYGY